MKAFGLVLLLAASALSAPQGSLKEPKEAQPQLRQIYNQGEPLVLQSTPQFGARLSQSVPAGAQLVYLQGGYQQPQYYSAGQQVAYLPGAPSQAFLSGAPSQAFYSAQYAQPQANLVAVKKTVKPAVYNVAAGAPQGVYRPPVVSTFKVQPPQAAFSGFKAAVPAPAPALKFQAAPAPAPAVKLSAAPSQYSQISPEPYHVIVKQVEDNNFDGSFTYSYETDHGIVVESSGFLKNAGTEDEAQVMQGSYTYYSPEGVPITTTYIADENGFQVQGDHLPVAPPLPEAIAKSIEYQRSLPPSPEEELPSRQ